MSTDVPYSSYGNWVKPIPQVLARYGVDGHALLVRLGLDNHQAGERLPVQKTAEAWRIAAQLSGEPAIGVRAAESIQAASWGELGLAVLCCENLHQAIALLLKYPAFISDSITISAIENQHTLTLDILPASAEAPGVESLDFGMAAGFQLLRSVFPGQLSLKELVLTRKHLADRKPYQDFYGCEHVQVNSASARQVYALSDIYQPLPFANGELASHHEELVKRQLQRQGFALAQNNLMERVTAKIREQLLTGDLCQNHVAAALNLSSRHLQRKLKEQNTQFSHMVEQLRRNDSLTMLKARDKSLSDVAQQLGFSDHSNFTRAFKRWYGITPSQFQER